MNYRRMADNQDRIVSDETGLKIQVNSGACKGRKGDLYEEDLLVETKTCERVQKTFSIKRDWLDKIAKQSFGMGKSLWALIFSFGDRDQFVVLPLHEFVYMRQKIKQYELKEDVNEDKR